VVNRINYYYLKIIYYNAFVIEETHKNEKLQTIRFKI
jgi:hypothetical protein